MEFRLLGPLEVIGDDGAALALGGARPRALLALLLLSANEVVSTDRLIDGIWGETPPASALGALQVHVHALRKTLGAERIVTRAPGYASLSTATSSTCTASRVSSPTATRTQR